MSIEIQRLPLLETHQAIHGNSGGAMVRHSFAADKQWVPAGRFLRQEAEVEDELFAQVFYGDAVRLRIIWGNKDITSMNVGQLRALVNLRMRPVYAIINRSLNAGHENGFNSHDYDSHVRHVTDRGLAYVALAGGSEQDLKHTAVIGEAHDAGNMLDRYNHPIISPIILFYRVPELLDATLKEAEYIQEGIRMHDEKIAKRAILQLRDENPEVKGEDLYRMARQRWGLPVFGIILGDKTDATDRRRTPQKDLGRTENGHTALDRDGFIEPVLLANLDKAEVNDENFLWRIKFNPLFSDDEQLPQAYSEKSRLFEGNRVWVSEETQKEYSRGGIPYFITWQRKLLRNDAERIQLAAFSAFTLFNGDGGSPHIDYFDYEVADANGFKERMGVEIKYRLYRDNLEEGVAALKPLAFVPHQVPEEYKRVKKRWDSMEKINEEIEMARQYFEQNPEIDEYVSEETLRWDDQYRPTMTVSYVFRRGELAAMKKHLMVMFIPKQERKRITGEIQPSVISQMHAAD